jgi:hypothetical protein
MGDFYILRAPPYRSARVALVMGKRSAKLRTHHPLAGMLLLAVDDEWNG